ncbi:MAG: hypothetical protein C4320_10115, partial [Armatimonadota bacterium]
MDESRVVPQGFLESAPTLRRLIRNRSLWALNLPPLFYPVVLGLIISLCATALIGPIMIFEKVCITLLLLSSIFIA